MAGGWGVGSDEESSFGCRLKVRISTSLRSVRSSVLPLKDVHFILFPLLNYFIHFCNALTSIASLRHSLGPCVAAHPLKAPHISAYLAYSRCLFTVEWRNEADAVWHSDDEREFWSQVSQFRILCYRAVCEVLTEETG